MTDTVVILIYVILFIVTPVFFIYRAVKKRQLKKAKLKVMSKDELEAYQKAKQEKETKANTDLCFFIGFIILEAILGKAEALLLVNVLVGILIIGVWLYTRSKGR